MPNAQDYVSTEQTDSKVHVKFRFMDWLKSFGDGMSDEAIVLRDFFGNEIGRTPSPRSVYYDACDEIRKVTGVDEISFDVAIPSADSTLPSGGLPGAVPAPLSPVEVLQEIAKAINNAESVLNQQNFVIAAGSVQATVTVSLPGMAAAQATVQLTIGPKPCA